MYQSFSNNRWWNYLWLKSQKKLVAIIFLNLFFSALSGYYTPRIITSFYESLKDDVKFHDQLILLVVLCVSEYANRLIFGVATHRYIQILINQTRKTSFSLWLKSNFKKTPSQREDFPMGEVLARLMNDTDAVREVVSSGSFGIFIDVIFISSCLVSFLQLNSTTGLGLFIAEIIACYLLLKGSRAMKIVFMDVRRLTGLMARVVTDLTAGLTELFFSPNNRYATKRGEKIFEEFLNKQLHANIWDAGYYSAAESLYPILIALVMILLPFSQITEVAILAALIDLIQKSITPIKDIASKVAVLSRARTGIDRIHQFNQSFSEPVTSDHDFKDLMVHQMIFKLRSFQYPMGFSLKDISFEIKKGEILGVIGESGCGKSTLLKLLSGQFDVFDGSIQIDQQKIDALKENELNLFRPYVSLISQDSHVFSETLRFNLTLGDDEGIEDFWKLAHHHISYLNTWGVSLEQKITSSQLSLGQKQIVSGLRALFLKKPIILMDEISSGLDSELEGALRDLLNFFKEQTITIIVTHRLETILHADKIMLIKQGTIQGLGHHQTLLQNSYYEEFLKHLL